MNQNSFGIFQNNKSMIYFMSDPKIDKLSTEFVSQQNILQCV